MTNKALFSPILFAAILATHPGAAQSGGVGFAAVPGKEAARIRAGRMRSSRTGPNRYRS